MYFKNYLSLWIENLGVVPLFSFAFFLFRPAFLALKFLLVLVLVVLDAIVISLKKLIKSVFRPSKLTILLLIVKVFVLQNTITAQELNEDIFLSKGEQYKLEIKSLKSFSVGNKEVISTTYKENILFIKGKSIGFSDILVKSNAFNKKIRVFIVSKREQLKKVRIAQSLRNLDLSVQIKGNLLDIKGEIITLPSYLIFIKSINHYNGDSLINVKLNIKLRNEIIEQIYKESYRLGSWLTKCENQDYRIMCSFKGLNENSSKFKHLVSKYSIDVVKNSDIKQERNYKVSYRFFKITDSNEKVRDLGPSSININLLSLLNSNSDSLVEGDVLEIKDSFSKATVLAKPELKMILNTQGKINLGGEFPIVTTNSIGQSTQWKYYGLKVKNELKSRNNRLLINFHTSLSTPFEQNISSTGGSSSVYLNLDKYTKLFQIGFKQEKLRNESIPLLNKIPILKYLFQRDLNSNSYQKIICYIKVEISNE